MVPSIRQSFNSAFSEEKYQHFLQSLNSKHPGAIDFRVAETPIFIPASFTKKMLSACESIIDVIVATNFKKLTEQAVPQQLMVPNETDYTNFIAFDFGICTGENGAIDPQLIEMQGFPSLFSFQVLYDEILRQHFEIPKQYTAFLNGYDANSYIQTLKKIIIGNHLPENVILLELFPHRQKTRIDFYCTKDYTGIETVCLTELMVENENIFYLHRGQKTPVYRIYNRIIFDELLQQSTTVQKKAAAIFFNPVKAEWIPHPNWFYRISKYTLPFIEHPNIPETHFLNCVHPLPENLNQYVVKPVFSFAGQGVIIDVNQENITAIPDPQNWIIQKKVDYAAIIETPDTPAKAEIRLFYFWDEDWKRPKAMMNLARLSKGKMIGTRYNKDQEWVGGSMAYFEQPA
ncbi:MAG: hypothetical protein EKK39_07505 [Sphingobacteriales bacterium]|uniref:hypothetical protein n=1 Tax=Hydrotalea flava TaxID=714549 RepID=UPI0008332232|nr:hypothetical protein [Hydrotalea flava]RTL52054.1 MAG: hypothetical protein EKK39_07505 [Sphingobacteriales bacterium]